MSKRLVFSMICLAACFSVGTWAAYQFVFSSTSEIEIMEAVDENAAGPDTVPELKPCEEDKQNFSFRGISFDYDRCALGEAKAAEVPAYPLQISTDKPDSVAPAHLNFTFAKGEDERETNIDIFPVQDFPKMYRVNKRYARLSEKKINQLKRVLRDKTYRSDGEIPYLQFLDASQLFQAHVKLGKFDRGDGIYFLNYFAIENDLLSNDHLRYVFEGLTNDGRYYILAEMPVSVDFLPNLAAGRSGEYSYDGYTNADVLELYRSEFVDNDQEKYTENKKRYDQYVSNIIARIEGLEPREFHPDLTKLEELIDSIKIKE